MKIPKLNTWAFASVLAFLTAPAFASHIGERVNSTESQVLSKVVAFKEFDSKPVGHFKVVATLGSENELNPIGTLYVAFEKELFDDFDTYAVSLNLQKITSIQAHWKNSNFSISQGEWLEVRGTYYDDKAHCEVSQLVQIKLTDATGVLLENLEISQSIQ